jgi:hypothetical protein
MDELIKSMGDFRLVLADPTDGKHIEVPVTLNDLIYYIHEQGGCSGRHINKAAEAAKTN